MKVSGKPWAWFRVLFYPTANLVNRGFGIRHIPFIPKQLEHVASLSVSSFLLYQERMMPPESFRVCVVSIRQYNIKSLAPSLVHGVVPPSRQEVEENDILPTHPLNTPTHLSSVLPKLCKAGSLTQEWAQPQPFLFLQMRYGGRASRSQARGISSLLSALST